MFRLSGQTGKATHFLRSLNFTIMALRSHHHGGATCRGHARHLNTEKQRGKTMAKSKKPAGAILEQRKQADRRSDNERRLAATANVAERRVGERREKVNRRRQIDPTTCERDYTTAEIEFMHALELYKRSSGRMFPTCSEVLEVLLGLGYAKKNARSIPAGEPSEASEQLSECC
jgi:hypothetical protein